MFTYQEKNNVKINIKSMIPTNNPDKWYTLKVFILRNKLIKKINELLNDITNIETITEKDDLEQVFKLTRDKTIFKSQVDASYQSFTFS